MPEQFEDDRKFDGKNSLQDFDAKEMYLHSKNRSETFQKHRRMFCFHHFRVFTRCCFQTVLVILPFSKSTVFKICRRKMCRFRVNGRPIRHIFHRFQNVAVSCERCLKVGWFPNWLTVKEQGIDLLAILKRIRIERYFATFCRIFECPQ